MCRRSAAAVRTGRGRTCRRPGTDRRAQEVCIGVRGCPVARLAALRCVDADVAHRLGSAVEQHVNSVAVNHLASRAANASAGTFPAAFTAPAGTVGAGVAATPTTGKPAGTPSTRKAAIQAPLASWYQSPAVLRPTISTRRRRPRCPPARTRCPGQRAGWRCR